MEFSTVGKWRVRAIRIEQADTVSAVFWLLVAAVGIAAIVWGAEAFAEHLSSASTRLGVSAFALAILLAGAEPEELATAVTASLRHAPAIAFGDVIGANVAICLVALGVGVDDGIAVRPLRSPLCDRGPPGGHARGRCRLGRTSQPRRRPHPRARLCRLRRGDLDRGTTAPDPRRNRRAHRGRTRDPRTVGANAGGP